VTKCSQDMTKCGHAECRHAPGVMEYSPTAIVALLFQDAHNVVSMPASLGRKSSCYSRAVPLVDRLLAQQILLHPGKDRVYP